MAATLPTSDAKIILKLWIEGSIFAKGGRTLKALDSLAERGLVEFVAISRRGRKFKLTLHAGIDAAIALEAA